MSPTHPYPHHTPAPNGRPTLGFLTANIHIGASRTVWPGLADAAEQHDVNLMCFPGGGLGVGENFESQRNAIYDLADPSNLQGMVSWASTIGASLPQADVVRFHQRFQSIPTVSLAQPIENIPTLQVDSYQGMRAGIAHLIETHHLRRLAFIRGPESHFYAQERYRAYCDTLEFYHIPLDSRLVTRPVSWNAGVKAMQQLLEENGLRPGVDFDAVVAVSDLLALDALKVLSSHGLRVPADVAVIGFNDSGEGRVATPPLTSVTLPFYEHGVQAVTTVLAMIAGENVPQQVLLHSGLVVRQSCGCPSELVQQARAGEVAPARGSLLTALPTLTAALCAELWPGEAEKIPLAPLVNVLNADLSDDVSSHFLAALEHNQLHEDGQALISAIRRGVLPYVPLNRRTRAEDLFEQARVLVSELGQRALAFQHLQGERQADTLREIGQALITTFDIENLADVLTMRLPQLGIQSCYLSLYENPTDSLEQARLVLAFTEQGRIPLPADGRRFTSRQLVPPDLLPQHRRYSYIVEPLYFREQQIGFALFEIGPHNGAVYEVLRGNISSALKGALLFQEARQARLAAEKADQIKTRLLANVSHELRTPLNIILDHTRQTLANPPDADVSTNLQHIQNSAEHQLRLINDLLDLSRAEIDELDLYLELIDPRPLLEDAYQSMAGHAAAPDGVEWQLHLPERLPVVRADPVRLRQILLNLLSNASKFTQAGHITLGAEIEPPYLHIWIEDTGSGIPKDQQERIFEPFATLASSSHRLEGIGLGLSITRRLVALHGGAMTVESTPGQGSTFHVVLPLPSLNDQTASADRVRQPVLLLISNAGQAAPEIVELCRRQGLELRPLNAETTLSGLLPAALAWDLSTASAADWALVRRLRTLPGLPEVPFILFGQPASSTQPGLGLTGFVDKQAGERSLLELIEAAHPQPADGVILIVDDDPQARAAYQRMLAAHLPGFNLRTAVNGIEALTALQSDLPSLVLLDLMMPGMDGFEVLDWMRARPQFYPVPVIILSSKLLSLEDVRRLEQHAGVTLHTKGVLTEAETAHAFNQALFGTDALPQHTSALVKRAVAYLHQNYTRPLSRWEVANAVGVSEDYLTRVFSRELSLSPWEYLNRYRVNQARLLLSQTSESIHAIAHRVGFADQGYFSRVFHKITGRSPAEFRKRPVQS